MDGPRRAGFHARLPVLPARAGHVERSAPYMDALIAWRERERAPAFPTDFAERARAQIRDAPVPPEAAALMRALCRAFLKGPTGEAA